MASIRVGLKISKNFAEDCMNLFNQRRNASCVDSIVTQGWGVKQLGIMATIFLPLSLAASILSMSARFASLDPIIYDLFGLCVLIGFCLTAGYVIGKVTKVLADVFRTGVPPEFISPRLSFVWSRFPSLVPPILKISRLSSLRSMTFLLFILGLALISFMIGMFEGIYFGMNVLYFQVIGIYVIFLIFQSVCYICRIFPNRRFDPNRFMVDMPSRPPVTNYITPSS